MSFYLCHHCLEWVELDQTHCPRCDRLVNLSASDPALEVLQRRMGHLVDSIGTVRVLHNELKSLGCLYQTSLGLMFMPFQLHDIIEEEKCPLKAANWWQSVASLMPPTNLFDWLSDKLPSEQVQQESREEINTTDPVGLARLLMRHPGVLFIERSAIQKIVSHRRNWTMYRHHSQAVRLKAMGDWRQFYQNMSALLRSSGWEALGTASSIPPANS